VFDTPGTQKSIKKQSTQKMTTIDQSGQNLHLNQNFTKQPLQPQRNPSFQQLQKAPKFNDDSSPKQSVENLTNLQK
jgi:hypothetical protein